MNNIIKTIGIVDENLKDTLWEKTKLEELGFNVVFAERLGKILDFIERADIDAFIFDIHIGGLSAFDLIQHMKKAGINKPVFLASNISADYLSVVKDTLGKDIIQGYISKKTFEIEAMKCLAC